MPAWDPLLLTNTSENVLGRGRSASSLFPERRWLYTRIMRISGILILVVVISMAVVVILQSRDVTAKRDALAVIATELREEGVEGAKFDRERAFELIAVLEGLSNDPDSIPNHLEDLKTISSTAASWSAGAASPSPELHASVAIRKAAGELRDHAVRPSPSTLRKAQHELEKARHALTITSPGDGTSAPSGLVTEGVQDRINNLEAAQKEKMLEVEEELGP
jgi:hypothetical protein